MRKQEFKPLIFARTQPIKIFRRFLKILETLTTTEGTRVFYTVKLGCARQRFICYSPFRETNILNIHSHLFEDGWRQSQVEYAITIVTALQTLQLFLQGNKVAAFIIATCRICVTLPELLILGQLVWLHLSVNRIM